MVFYSQQALRDFDDIFYGLLLWERVGLSKPFVESYIKELKTKYENIPNNSFHPDTTFSPHKKMIQKSIASNEILKLNGTLFMISMPKTMFISIK